MWKNPFILLAVFVLGLGIGIYIEKDNTGIAPAGDAVEIEANPIQPETAEEVPVPVLPQSDKGFASLEEALHAIPVPDTDEGLGVIKGRVRTPSGKPVAGVKITINQRWDGRHKHTGSSEKGLEKKVQDVVRRHYWNKRSSKKGQSDENGEYEIGGLAESQFRVNAELKGYKIEADRHQRTHKVSPGSTINFVARTVVEIKASVILPDGQTAKHAKIHYSKSASILMLGNLIDDTGVNQKNQVLINTLSGANPRNITVMQNWLSAGFNALSGQTYAIKKCFFGKTGRHPQFINSKGGNYKLARMLQEAMKAGTLLDKLNLPEIPGAFKNQSIPILSRQYRHPAATEKRVTKGRPDPGAFEYRK